MSERDDYIAIQNLSVSYGKTQVLSDVSLQIPKSKMTFLIGPNGSGKSTLIKAIAGIIPYQGFIQFSTDSQEEPYQVGYVPQRLEIDFSLPVTVYELMRLSLVACRHHSSEQENSIHISLSKTGVWDLRNKRLGSLSGGQLQRVLLARAIVHKPTILLLDEPEAGIDQKGEDDIFRLIRQLQQEGVTSVIVSHNLKKVGEYADVVALFGNIGQGLIMSGSASDVLSHYNIT